MSLLIGADDRFIAKELSKIEIEALATFAPAYFDYISSAIAAGVSEFRPIDASSK